MIDKPKDSSSVTQWKLANETIYWAQLEDQLEDKTALETTIENAILVKTNVPELTNTLLYYIAESEGIEDSLTKEIAMLQERKARFKKRSENLRASIKMVFDRFDLKKMNCPYGTISQVTRKESKLNVQDEGELIMNYPELYIKVEPKLDKTALKALLQSGTKIEGVSLEDSTTIMIRR